MVKYYSNTGECRPEYRGGSRQTEEQREIRQSMVEHIMRFKVERSHYSREKSKREYLQCDLSLSNMFRLWLAEREAAGLPGTKKHKKVYERVFFYEFNLSFSNPRTDICYKCRELKAKVTTGSAEDRTLAKHELNLYRARARKFYSSVREERNRRNTLVLNFDLEKTLPLPKTNIGDAFYKRQMWVYNLGIVMGGRSKRKENCFIYTWLESQSGRGANEIVSCVIHMLNTVEQHMRE